jgi:hypothetical protein
VLLLAGALLLRLLLLIPLARLGLAVAAGNSVAAGPGASMPASCIAVKLGCSYSICDFKLTS